MEALMSNILKNAARVKRPAEDSPLDLTTKKFLRHTCDSLIEPADLRLGTDSNSESYSQIKIEPCDKDVYDKPGCLITPSKGYSSWNISSLRQNPIHRIKEEVESSGRRSAPHPFSIDALLGYPNNITSNSTAPAIVYKIHGKSSAPHKTFNQDPATCSTIANKDDPFWCHVCNELCNGYKDAQGHQYRHYMQGVKCNLKKALFQQHGYVTKHAKHDDEKLRCGLCDKIFAHCFFAKHQRLHDGHFCDICNHEFSSNSRLQDHMNIHTGSTPFACKICNRKFAKRSSLTQHQRYHRDHQSFKCGYCPKSFNSKYARAVHERLHTGENPFKCQVPGCNRAFPQKIQLQLHMNSH